MEPTYKELLEKDGLINSQYVLRGTADESCIDCNF